LSTFVSVDEQSKHESRHVLRLGEAQRAAAEALDPGPQIAVCALDLLRVLLAHLRLLGIAMPDRVSNGGDPSFPVRPPAEQDVMSPYVNGYIFRAEAAVDV